MLQIAIIFFLILSVLVFVHEFGHFITAILIGVKVEEFGFGLPPRAWGKKVKGIIYSLNWLPIGGFVKLAGEDEDEPVSVSERQKAKYKHFFWARSKKERAAILLAGVTMNFLLAVGITAFLLTQGVPQISGRVHVEAVVAGSPAEQAGLREQDIVTHATYHILDNQIETKAIRIPQDLIDSVKEHAGTPVTLQVERGGEKLNLVVTPRKDPPEGQGPMGVAVTDLEIKTYSLVEAPLKAVVINLTRARDMGVGIGTMIMKLVTGKSPGADVAGPIGIAQVTGQAVKFGWKAVLEFMSILSLNLAVLNILPIPALDGGRLTFIVFEKLLGRKVRPAFEKQTHQIGMIILLILVVLISINDILRLARGG